MLTLNPSLLHTTPLGKERIKRNIGLDVDDVIAWCKKTDLNIERRGKNFYVYAPDFVLTINAKSHTIITAHKIKKVTK
ncbi:MAG: DUF3781 domain-containing protein [Candidatus Peribacteria bacterium]|jgi:hypothetical protein|nr:DUF3781 domain-containing protein [Candidatus Peribacteria bacterium]